jgi:SPP1 family predicted phage head-tail adaptor
VAIKISAGELDRRLTVQIAGTVRDEYGEMIPGWTDLATDIYARVRDISGREFLAAAAEQSRVQTEIVIWFRADVLPAMQVLDHTDPAHVDTYNIIAALREEPWLRLMCMRQG